MTRAGLSKDALTEFHSRQAATNRFLLAAVILSEDVLKTLRREVGRVTELLVDQEDIERVLREQVIKRDTLEGEQAQTAARRVSRWSERSIRGSDDVETPQAALPGDTAATTTTQVTPPQA